MKVSKYTYCHECSDGSLVIFNSLSGSILKCENGIQSQKIKMLLQKSEDLIQQPEKWYTILCQHGILVEDNVDEKAIADYRFFQDIMGARLDLTIMPTEDCNFRCSYCYEAFKRGNMSADSIKCFERYILSNIRKYTGVSVSWFGGEPLEAIHEMEVITDILLTACKKRKIPYDAGVVTNGYNLSPDILQRLIRMRVRQIQVTIDGTRENHNKYKCHKNGLPTYDVVLNNLRYIRDYCDCNTLSIVIRTNVSRDLIQDIDNVIDFYNQEFGNDKRFNFFFRPVGDWGGERVKNIGDSVFKSYQSNIVYDKIAHNSTMLNYKMYYMELTKGIDICYAAKNNAYIVGSDLKLYKCSCKFDAVNNMVGDLSNINEQYVNEALSSKWVMVGINPSTKCSQCVLYPVCHNAACIADSVEGKIPGSVCPHMKQNLDAYLEILSRDPAYCKRI